MTPEQIRRSRLSFFGPLNIEDINDFLTVSKEKFFYAYTEPWPYVVNRYQFEILYTIGQGSYGKVLLVRDANKHLYAMKALEKEHLVKSQQLNHTLNEKRILQGLDFPFGVRLEFFSIDNSYIFFIMPFVPGGDMFTLLRKMNKFDETLARFYAAQVVLGFEYLHYLSLVYRDLKPENLLIDNFGYVKITDFGFSKVVTSRTYTLCGTPPYLPPEMISGVGYGASADWWSLGVLIYEMNSGYEPFYSRDEMKMMGKIMSGHYLPPHGFSPELIDIVDKLLTVDVTRRYGCLQNGIQDIKDHVWFRSVHWLALFNRRLEAPYVPESIHLFNFPMISALPALTPSQFDEYAEEFRDF